MANIIGGAQAYRDSFDPIAYLSNYINVRQLEATTPIYDFKLRKANEAVQDFLLKGKNRPKEELFSKTTIHISAVYYRSGVFFKSWYNEPCCTLNAF